MFSKKNYRNSYKSDDILNRKIHILKNKSCIGKTVYKIVDSFGYITVLTDKQRIGNVSESQTYTQELFELFCVEYIEYQIKHLTDSLLNTPLI